MSSWGLISPLNYGQSSLCPEIDYDTEISLDECKQLACDSDGNVFHYLDGECEIKFCWDDLSLSDEWDAYNIYVLAGECSIHRKVSLMTDLQKLHVFIPFSEPNPCDTETCQNDGVCLLEQKENLSRDNLDYLTYMPNVYIPQCICDTGFTGRLCEKGKLDGTTHQCGTLEVLFLA